MAEPDDVRSAFVLPLDSPAASLEVMGGKGASLARLAAAGLPVPSGFHVTTAAYRRFVAENDLQPAILDAVAAVRPGDPASLDAAASSIRARFEQGRVPDDVATAIRAAYAALNGGEAAVAVRSSATAEDLPDLSFAGQQETYLNVSGDAAVLDAVRRCWASLWTARAIGYRTRSSIPSESVALAVVVQALVPADVAGILFTANPMTGAREQLVINAAWGLGEAIVGGLVSPDTLVVDKATGTTASQDVADKAVMTVRVPGGTREEPVSGERRRQPALTAEQVGALTQIGARIETLYGRPMDVEWAIQGDQVFVLQARPITTLPAAPAAPALDWRTPHPRGRYARSSVIELLPDPLTPLFATLALPAWNRALVSVLDALGMPGVFRDDMLTTINDYAYYDWTFSRGQTATMLLALPRILSGARRLIRHARRRWEQAARPRYTAAVRAWAEQNATQLSAVQTLTAAQEVVDAAADHYLAIQSGILPAAYMSEALFRLLYGRLIKQPSDPPALTFLLGFESAPIRAEEALYDLAVSVRRQEPLASYLLRAPSDRIAAGLQRADHPTEVVAGWSEFRTGFQAYLDRFGHAVYDLDFAKPVPADEPAPLIETLKFFLGDQAPDPRVRQARAAAARAAASQTILGRLRGPRHGLVQLLLGWAQEYAPLREDALADVGLGWPLIRRLLRELGARLVRADALAAPDDVYWLRLDELHAAAAALDAGQRPEDRRDLVAGRRATWAAERRATPPAVLPAKSGARLLGFDLERWMPARTSQDRGDVITGIGASPGRVTATARVIAGPDEFGQLRPGDVLVAKITTPAWTPLFALAAGVVTDVGGPLSHSSIVAREYHIPAVLGTGIATARIRGGQRVAVDGDAGTVTIVPYSRTNE